MPYSFPLSIPGTPITQAMTAEFTFKYARARSPSEYNFNQQVYVHEGNIVEAVISLPKMLQDDALEWVGFLAALRGAEGTFDMGDPSRSVPRGNAGGSPRVRGASQSGYTLISDGWTPSTSNILRRGDWIQLGQYLHMIVMDVDSDSQGIAQLDMATSLRFSPANNSTIIVNSPKGRWRLAENQTEWTVNQALHYGIIFAAVEDI